MDLNMDLLCNLGSPVARPRYPSKFWGNHFIAFFDTYDGPE